MKMYLPGFRQVLHQDIGLLQADMAVQYLNNWHMRLITYLKVFELF